MIKLNTVLTNFEGQPIFLKGPDGKETPATVKELICSVLLGEFQGETVKQKMERYMLAKEYYSKDEILLSQEECEKICGYILSSYPTPVACAAVEIIEAQNVISN